MVASKPPTVSAIQTAAAIGLPAVSAPGKLYESILYQGWVLKKRRKKLQGFGRRYFTLYHSGLLAYSFEPGQPFRDQISLPHAAITTAPGRKDIHIDSDTATFHIKCLSTADFDNWMSALRKFIGPMPEARMSFKMPPRQASFNITRSAGTVLDEMGATITQLEEAIQQSFYDSGLKKHHSMNKNKDKDKHKDNSKEGGSVFGIFKRSSHHSSLQEFGVEGNASESDASSVIAPPQVQQRILAALTTLKAQHATLTRSIRALSHIDLSQSVHASPLPFTAEETEGEDTQNSPSRSRFSTPLTRKSKRTSIATSFSDTASEWYDASDGMGEGAEEFVMEDSSPDVEQPSRFTNNDSRSTLDHMPGSSADTDTEEEDAPKQRYPSHDSQTADKDAVQVVRRTALPSPPVGDQGSLFAMLKKNIGKDLSTIAFPVTFNEPLTLLQHAAEELEYFDVLEQAAQASDPVQRLCYVAAFAVSGYAHTRHRSGRKGFNPMLAETFEDIRMKFIAEKVRHQPLVMAYHAEGSGWELYATSTGRTKFWGKSLEIIPTGITHLKIGEDHYEWKKPSSFMRNLMLGTKYLEHQGKMDIENVTTGARCVLDFKQSGYWAAPNTVTGTVYSASDEVVGDLEGKWDEQLSQTIDSSHFRVLWRMTPFPKNTHEYYGFTSFGMTLNEITNDLQGKLPPTDSRYRPDVRALEEGNLDLAEEEKVRVEEMQRERRKLGNTREPRWFKQVGEEWVYAGGYWEARARGWKDAPIEALW